MLDALQVWLQRLEHMQPDRIEFGLDRINKVARAGKLHDPAFRVVTVAGTNGKGSTVAYIAQLLRSRQLSVGVYTSPHFIDFNERIVIDGERIAEAELCEAFEFIESSRQSVALTYFEFTTLAAIYCFSKRKIDVAVLEVGLGGRLDAVNAWDSEVACITSIGIDHTDWLGDDREVIGFEKAGVARRGCALICGELDPPASIANVAKDTGARLLLSGEDFGVNNSLGDGWQYYSPHGMLELPAPAIGGSWARQNAAVAICACEQLLGEPAAERTVREAMHSVTMVGRMQHLVHESVAVLLDVAHNQQAAIKLADYLANNAVSGATIAVFGCMQDKDAGAIIDAMSPVIDSWCVAQVDYPRAMGSEQISALLGEQKHQVFTSVTQAFDSAVAQSTVENRVIVFGSFHVVGPVLAHLS